MEFHEAGIELSVRSNNALKAYGITTVDGLIDLINKPTSVIMGVPELGSKSAVEIAMAVARAGSLDAVKNFIEMHNAWVDIKGNEIKAKKYDAMMKIANHK